MPDARLEVGCGAIAAIALTAACGPEDGGRNRFADPATTWSEAPGAANAAALRRAGVYSIAELAAADPEALGAALVGAGAQPRPTARVRVWVRAARAALAP